MAELQNASAQRPLVELLRAKSRDSADSKNSTGEQSRPVSAQLAGSFSPAHFEKLKVGIAGSGKFPKGMKADQLKKFQILLDS